jgi:hypothetical protein
MTSKFDLLPKEKRTAFDALGRGVEATLLDEWEHLVGDAIGPIKLLNGVEGRTGGFGFEHIIAKPERIKQIQSIGFNTVHSYIRYILDDVTHMGFQADRRMVIVREDGPHYHHLICQWDALLRVWSVTTAIPKRNMRNLTVSWKKAA